MPSNSKQARERQGELARIYIQTSIFNVSKEIRMHNSKSSSFSSSSFQSLEDEPVADQDITQFDKSLQVNFHHRSIFFFIDLFLAHACVHVLWAFGYFIVIYARAGT
jgi:hypothetical protein